MSFIPVVMYLVGLMVFGFLYWLLDGLLNIFNGLGIADTTTYNVLPTLMYFWYGIVVLYLIFGGIWVVRKYNEKEYSGGMF